MTISSPRTVSPVRSARDRGYSLRENSRPSARRKVSTSSSCSALWLGLRSPSTILRASRLIQESAPVLAFKTPPHRRGVDQGLEVGPGPLLLPVAAGVGDGQGRLGGEEDQASLIVGGELGAPSLSDR